MNSRLNEVIATGGWCSGDPCPDSPKKKHFFKDIKRKPARTGIGEYLITSQCKWCGCLIKDCPTINL